jgi:hypothetical protein
MTTILWRWLDREGHEAAKLDGRVLRGNSVLRNEDSVWALTYSIQCDDAWRTIAASVRGWSSESEIAIDLASNGGRWTINGKHVAAVDGCVDVDLNFSPSTNLLPIRRLNLAIGEEASVRAAWLRFPELALEPLEQSYTRVGASVYRYKSASFTADITVNEAGLVLDYGVWKSV